MDHIFGIRSKNSLPSPRAWRFPLMFYCLTVLYFTLKSVIYLQLILVWSSRNRSKSLLYLFIYLASGRPIGAPVPLVKKAVFPSLSCFAYLSKICIWRIYVGLFMGLWFCPITCVSVPLPILHCPEYCTHIIRLEIRWIDSSCFILLCVSYSSAFAFSHKF